jgi:hypothetical protein
MQFLHADAIAPKRLLAQPVKLPEPPVAELGDLLAMKLTASRHPGIIAALGRIPP